MNEIRLIDRNFAHATCCSNGSLDVLPKYFRWYRGNEPRDITVFVDGEFRHSEFVDSRVKIWLLLEPPVVKSSIYAVARDANVQSRFDRILTFDRGLALSNPSVFLLYPLGGCWIPLPDRRIHAKTKDVSIIVSNKKRTEGQRLRHEIVRRFGSRLDVFGTGYRYIPCKTCALNDYRFSVVIENSRLDDYFSEKLIDAMATGTIPIYWGTPALERFEGGIIYPLEKIEDFVRKPTYARETYARALESGAIDKNLEISRSFATTEDWLWENLLCEMIR